MRWSALLRQMKKMWWVQREQRHWLQPWRRLTTIRKCTMCETIDGRGVHADRQVASHRRSNLPEEDANSRRRQNCWPSQHRRPSGSVRDHRMGSEQLPKAAAGEDQL